MQVRVHLGLEIQGKEPFQHLKGLTDQLIRHAMVLDVEETAVVARIVDLLCDLLPCLERAVDLADVDSGYAGESGGLLRDLAVGRLGARGKVDIFAIGLSILHEHM